ncbi:hypothetical protein [Streptomyces sp. NBC_01264]|uniref:hypothetical protein n=1 Tax=Streptomyces sp. NBC_01264 TaxID=2903804 RepID=UPI00225A94D0|nr:hypothetical protein [Streptomyces sp. NBC_01264]MCX4778114.1 hypothetical protein [Streptomyces sp. NBC_01264]
MSEPQPLPLPQSRIAEIHAALKAVPAPPWCWIGTRNGGGPQLVTDHSGRQYILAATKPADVRGDELIDPYTDAPIYGDLKFRDCQPQERWSSMRTGAELAVGRTDYDPDSIVDVDNPVARWLRDSAGFVTELLAEVALLRQENSALEKALGLNEAA